MTRIALVGAGRMGQVHLRVLRALAGVEVAAVVDPFAGDATHADVRQLLDHGAVDGAVVAAPSTEHLRIVPPLLEAGIPTLCEKPCGTTSTEAAEAVRLAASSGTPLRIGFWRRFVPALRELREQVAAGGFGQLLLVRSQQWDERPPSRQFRVTSGGILTDMGVHEFDQVRWLSGQEIDCRAAVQAEIGVDPPVEGDPESVEAIFRLSGGGLIVVSLGRRFPPGDICRVEVVGTEAVADIRFLWPPESQRAFDAAVRAQDEAFVDLVRGGEPQGAGPEDALAALEAAEQAQAMLARTEVTA
jgi:myo-inositol 2-dehydrogenase / D-chiro-inositol 1-dehydrogenase